MQEPRNRAKTSVDRRGITSTKNGTVRLKTTVNLELDVAKMLANWNQDNPAIMEKWAFNEGMRRFFKAVLPKSRQVT